MTRKTIVAVGWALIAALGSTRACTAMPCDADLVLAAIEAEPDEDTARLAYADLLQEQGGAANEARAEFIRGQCAIASRALGHEKERSINEHIVPLFLRYATDWFPVLGDRSQWDFSHLALIHQHSWEADLYLSGRNSLKYAQILFRRGFIEATLMPSIFLIDTARAAETVRPWRSRALRALTRPFRQVEPEPTPATRFIGGTEAFLQQCGPVQKLAIIGLHPFLRNLSQVPSLSKIRALSFMEQEYNAEDMEILAAIPQFAQLRQLSLSSAIGDAGLRALLRSPYLRNVHTLCINECGIGVAGIEALVESPLQLVKLQLNGNAIGNRGLELLAAWPGAKSLKELFVCRVGREGDRAYWQLVHSPNLRHTQIFGY